MHSNIPIDLPDGYDASRLAFWLRHDAWSARDAALILLNVDPDSARMDAGDTDEDPKIIHYTEFGDQFPIGFPEDTKEVRSFRRRLSDVLRIAGSNRSDSVSLSRTPFEWVEWAVSKKLEVPWLAWARKSGLIGEGASTESRLERPLMQRERATLLVIIAALARELNVDLGITSKAAAAIENMTIAIDARVAARTIEEHLKRVPDALERRERD